MRTRIVIILTMAGCICLSCLPPVRAGENADLINSLYARALESSLNNCLMAKRYNLSWDLEVYEHAGYALCFTYWLNFYSRFQTQHQTNAYTENAVRVFLHNFHPQNLNDPLLLENTGDANTRSALREMAEQDLAVNKDIVKDKSLYRSLVQEFLKWAFKDHENKNPPADK
jgi:hypothetical protein